MALRRLFSGWLIAMAALARSLAEALERASEDRSASAPDPVMAALAERYPGAPAHWLAHVAERTSQLAESGEAPFSLDSDPAAWPSPLTDGPVSRPLPIEAPPPRRPEPTPRRDVEVPSLAALRERPSEVWRRPEPESRRRPRPVFAAAVERSTPSAAPTASAPAPRRPRSPLSLVSASPKGDIQGDMDPPRAAPGPDASASRTAFREASWSDPPPSRSVRSEQARSGVQEVSETSRAEPVLTQAALKSLAPRSEEAAGAVAAPKAAIRRRRAWFFAKPAPGHSGHPLDLAAFPRRGRGEAMEAVTAIDATPPRPGFRYAISEPRTVGPDRIWRALTPSTARRTIFQTLASLHAKTRRPADHARSPEPRSRHAPPSASLSSTAVPRPPAPSTVPAPAFTSSHAESPARVVEIREPSRPVGRRRASIHAVPAGQTGDEGRRSAFATPRSGAPRPAPRRFDDRPPDSRWPVLPPTTLTAPAGVETAPPRWDVLAREQEEGRWNV